MSLQITCVFVKTTSPRVQEVSSLLEKIDHKGIKHIVYSIYHMITQISDYPELLSVLESFQQDCKQVSKIICDDAATYSNINPLQRAASEDKHVLLEFLECAERAKIKACLLLVFIKVMV